MKQYDVEYVTSIYITSTVEAESQEEAVEKADALWRGKYPVVTEPSDRAPWLRADDIHVSKDWEVNWDGMEDEDEDEDEDENGDLDVSPRVNLDNALYE